MDYNKEANSKLNDDTVNKLKYAFSIGADVSAACFYAEISRPSYYSWIKEFPELEEEFNRLRENPVLEAYETIKKDMGNPDTAKWYLARKRKAEFSERQEVTGENGKAIIVQLSPEIAEKNDIASDTKDNS